MLLTQAKHITLKKIKTIEGRAIDPLFSPACIQHDAHNQVWVVDEIGQRIYRFDENLESPISWGGFGHEEGKFWYPTSIAFDEQGNVYVADKWNHRIQIFDQSGKIKQVWGRYGILPGEFNEPTSIVICNELVYVAERSNGRLQAFDMQGHVVHSYQNSNPVVGFYESKKFKNNQHYKAWLRGCSRFNPMETQFCADGFKVGLVEYPEHLAVTPEGTLIVIDAINHEIIEFSLSLAYLRHIRLEEKHPRKVFCAENCSIDTATGQQWFADRATNEIMIVSEDDVQLMHVDDFSISRMNVCGDVVYCSDFWNGNIVQYRIERDEEIV